MFTDQEKSTALILAEAKLYKSGWKFSPKDIGRVAAEILIEMHLELDKYARK